MAPWEGTAQAHPLPPLPWGPTGVRGAGLGAAQARPHNPHLAESGFASTSFCPCSCEMEAGEAILSLCSPVTVRSWTSCLIILAFSPPPAPRQATSQQTSVLPTNFLRPVLRLREVKWPKATSKLVGRISGKRNPRRGRAGGPDPRDSGGEWGGVGGVGPGPARVSCPLSEAQLPSSPPGHRPPCIPVNN